VLVSKADADGPTADRPRLLAGGNPQIPKGDGGAPVRAYIEAMPGWKSDIGRQLDALIEQAVPHVIKAVKWNQPLYGVEDRGFFVSYRCFTNYIKLTFFRGAALDPVPPIDFKDPDSKAIHIHEDDELDEQQLTSWFAQAAALPGWTP
jgi:hypothetical protein